MLLYFFPSLRMAPSATKTSSTNPWFGISMVLLGVIVGYGVATGMGGGLQLPGKAPAQVVPSAPQAPSAPAPSSDPADADDDAVLGDTNAKVTVIEFTDYQCPFCGRHFTQTFGQIKKNYVDTGKVKYVVRDFPLSFHQHAQKTAEATECADDQGKFWEMHDLLFTKQSEWSNTADLDATLTQYARDLKLNVGNFTDCLSSGKYTAEVQADFTAGSQAGIDGTPGFWIVGPDGTGKQVSGAQPFAAFSAAIDSYLN